MKLICFERKINTNAIRTRFDIISLITKFSEFIIDRQYSVCSNFDELKSDVNSFVYVNKMNRLFVIDNNHFFSVAFPFCIDINNEKLTFKQIEISHSIIATIASIINDSSDLYTIEALLDCIWNNIEDISEQKQFIDEIIHYLLSYEIGYIRYDIDPLNAERYADNGKPAVHPEYHFDINYTPSSTYKVGISTPIKPNEFVDFLNVTTDCWYVKP